MNKQSYMIPRLNQRALPILALWAVTMGVWFLLLQPNVVSTIESPELAFVVESLYAGAVLGTMAAGCWVASAAPGNWLRFAIQAGCILLGTAMLLKFSNDNTPARTLINCLGLILSQNLLFAWIGIPHFNEVRDQADRRRRQFSISDMIVATTAFALLLGFARWHQPPMNPHNYWIVFTAVCIGLSLISTLLCRAMLSVSFGTGLLRILGVVLLCVAGAVALAFCESKLTQPPIDYQLAIYYALSYLMVFAGHFAAIAVTAAAGRMGATAGKVAETFPGSP
ncbi:hypothetical protein CA13_39540 [Planctomycetes bacterium CA13]|uniref:Uncharacterized protein n=1 Tax=Novipirellula herctigrandis TaxID=2527986 RepID=A0A5C5Z6Q4_9BACT|nr:hypothetical protein CA13_39540 [Planctomycetes bacterium CA13]